MNRSLANVIFGGYGVAPTKGKVESCDTQTHLCHQEIDVNCEWGWEHDKVMDGGRGP